MSPNQEQCLKPERVPSVRRPLEVVIGDNVINYLGRPVELRQVQVRALWKNAYRVNVIVGTNAVSTRISDSFFVETDAEGLVLSSTPTITKRY